MLRVRSQSGKTIVVEEPLKYVEILDGNGDVAMVFFREKMGEHDSVAVWTPDLEEEADIYSKMYGVKWTGSIKGRWPKAEPLKVNR